MREHQRRLEQAHTKKTEDDTAEEQKTEKDTPSSPAEDQGDREQEEEKSELPRPGQRTGNSQAVAKFKIPKKKRPSVDEAKDPVKSTKDSAPPTSSSRQSGSLAASSPSTTAAAVAAAGIRIFSPDRKGSESDSSESELKIVVDQDSSQSDNDEAVTGKETKAKGKTEEQENIVGRKPSDPKVKKIAVSVPESESPASPATPVITNPVLQSLAAGLEPEDARKLLKKAAKMKNAEKLSLKQLKFLLLDDSDDSEREEEEPSKVVVKDEMEQEEILDKKDMKKAVAPSGGRGKQSKTTPPKLAPTPGTRRSRRLLHEEKVEEKAQEKVSR